MKHILGFCDATEIQDIHDELWATKPGLECAVRFEQVNDNYRVVIYTDDTLNQVLAQDAFNYIVGA